MSVPEPARQVSTSSHQSCQFTSRIEPLSIVCDKLTSSAAAGDSSTTSNALYSFRLLSALRSDDPSAVQPFLDDLQKSEGDERDRKIGQLLGMAVRIASGKPAKTA